MCIFGKVNHSPGGKLKESMNRAFLGLGGNLGNRLENLYFVRKALRRSCGQIRSASCIYESPAWGYDSSRPFLNQVVELETTLRPLELLGQLRRIESELGRKREQGGYSDRTVDIDLLFFEQEQISMEELELPHPRLASRRFVLQPLADIAPDLRHPVLDQSIRQLLEACADDSVLKTVVNRRAPSYICIEGNIGSGKSSLARFLAPALDATFLPERYDHMPLLSEFYREPERYAFALEFSFLLNRFAEIKSATAPEKRRLVSDYSLYKSLYFAHVNLRGQELAVFEDQFQTLHASLVVPDLIIHLNTGTAQLLENIRHRGRPYEQGITAEYLQRVEKSYRICFTSIDQIPQLWLSVESYHPELEKDLLVHIERFLVENFADTA